MHGGAKPPFCGQAFLRSAVNIHRMANRVVFSERLLLVFLDKHNIYVWLLNGCEAISLRGQLSSNNENIDRNREVYLVYHAALLKVRTTLVLFIILCTSARPITRDPESKKFFLTVLGYCFTLTSTIITVG